MYLTMHIFYALSYVHTHSVFFFSFQPLALLLLLLLLLLFAEFVLHFLALCFSFFLINGGVINWGPFTLLLLLFKKAPLTS